MYLISPPKNVRIWPIIAFEEFSQTSSKSSDIGGILSWEKSSGSSGWFGLNLGLISWRWSELIGFEWRRNVRLFLLLLQLQKMAPSLDFNGSCSRPRHEVNSCCGLTQNWNELLKWILLHQRGFIIRFGGVNVLSLLGPMLQKDWLVYREYAWSAVELRTWWV